MYSYIRIGSEIHRGKTPETIARRLYGRKVELFYLHSMTEGDLYAYVLKGHYGPILATIHSAITPEDYFRGY